RHTPRGANELLRMRLIGADAKAKVTGLEELPGKSNYFIGNDPKKWRRNVPNYAKVKYANVYPGIDLLYCGNQRQLEYDFVVQPGANPRQIRLAIIAQNQNSGSKSALSIDRNGDLLAKMRGGDVKFDKPVVYQPETRDLAQSKTAGQGASGRDFI